jgi:FtsZ-binding cell division protein ZapB
MLSRSSSFPGSENIDSIETLRLSPPHDGSEFSLFPELGQLQTSPAKKPVSASIVNDTYAKRPVIKIKMNNVGTLDNDLVSYLSGNNSEGEPPCLELVDDDDLDLRTAVDFDLESDLQSFTASQPVKESTLVSSVSRSVPIKITTGNGHLVSIKEVMEPTVLKQIGEMLSKKTKSTSCSVSDGDCVAGSSVNYSEFEDLVDVHGKKMTRNAINARENRVRKKKYLEGLEKNMQDLSNENTSLKQQVSNMQTTIEALTKDVQYLKGVLANQSHLSALLRNIHNTPGVNFSSSFKLPPPQAEEDIDSGKLNRKRNIDSVDLDADCECANINKDEDNQCPRPRESSSGSSKVQKLDHAYNRPVTRRSAGVKKSDKMKCEKSSDIDNQKENVKHHDLNLQDACGICLHVSKGNVSLEFCSSCSRNAASGRSKDS